MNATEEIQEAFWKTPLRSQAQSGPVFLEQLNVSFVSARDTNCRVQNLLKQSIQVVLLDKSHADLMEEGHVSKIGLELFLSLAELRLGSFSSGYVPIGFQDQHAIAIVRHELIA